jgi:hypothetical protein
MEEKLYSVEEANALLPHLAPALVELREKYEEASRIRAAIGRSAATNGGSTDRDKEQRTLARVAELAERLDGWDILLRDVASGLVDFPTIVHGEKAWLCWRLGEPEVAFWHSPDEGFQGRRPVGEI